MFLSAPGKHVTKQYSVSYEKASRAGTDSKYFAKLARALEYYQELKLARRRRVQIQLMTTVTTIEVLNAKELV